MLEVLHSRNPRQLVQDCFPAHEPHVRSANATFLSVAGGGPIKVRCACGRVLKLSRHRDFYSTDGRRAHREMLRKIQTPEGQGVVGLVKGLFAMANRKEES